MEKSRVKELESTTKEGMWNKATNEDTEAVFNVAFSNILKELGENPNLYYIESNQRGSLIVKKRSDNSPVYETNNLAEIGHLEEVGLTK